MTRSRIEAESSRVESCCFDKCHIALGWVIGVLGVGLPQVASRITWLKGVAHSQSVPQSKWDHNVTRGKGALAAGHCISQLTVQFRQTFWRHSKFSPRLFLSSPLFSFIHSQMGNAPKRRLCIWIVFESALTLLAANRLSFSMIDWLMLMQNDEWNYGCCSWRGRGVCRL